MFYKLPESVVCCPTLIWGWILNHYCFKYFSVPFTLSSPFDVPIIHILCFLWLSHRPGIFCSGFFVWFCFLSLFSLPFSLEGFYLNIPKLRDSFISCIQSSTETIKGILHFCYCFFLMSSISFWFFLRIFISLLSCPSIHECYLVYPLQLPAFPS